ncbi:MAG: heme o synthase [Actinomycetota bacterium]|nr:heme o synthase [Actinomycetota bacterium]
MAQPTAVAGATSGRPGQSRLDVLRAYVALTKPRIIELLLVTTVPTMMLAARGMPPARLLAATLVGGTLAAASANALNCYVDRDIDAVMRRTRRRPLARHAVTPRAALVFGVVLGILATAELAFATNLLSAALAVAAILFYVFVYTIGLKRRTPSNIVWGGAAGCMPVLIGTSAVTGRLSWAAVVLFGVIFLWTPPHFWALGLRYRDDYAAAGVPMLPVVATPVVVVRRMLAYSWAMVAVSLLLWPLATTAVYGGLALLFGAAFLIEAHRMYAGVRAGRPVQPMRLFHLSNTYLALLFCAVAVDALLG